MTSNKRLWMVISLLFTISMIVVLSISDKSMKEVVEERVEEQQSAMDKQIETAIDKARRQLSVPLTQLKELPVQNRDALQKLGAVMLRYSEKAGLESSVQEKVTQLHENLQLLLARPENEIEAESLRLQFQDILDQFEMTIQ